MCNKNVAGRSKLTASSGKAVNPCQKTNRIYKCWFIGFALPG